MKRLVSLIAATGVLAVASGAMATAIPFQLNTRPATIVNTNPASGQLSLQDEMNAVFGAGKINAVTDQSRVGAWTLAEGNVDIYRVALLNPNTTGTLGIFSLGTGAHADLIEMNNNQQKFQTDFSIQQNNTTGQYDLFYGNNKTLVGFGQSFGFYWQENANTISYTLDTQNGGKPLALSYLVPDGTNLTIPHNGYTFKTSADGDNDWLIGFENTLNNKIGSTSYKDSVVDFNDAIIYVEDMNPVPEPGTMMLLGAGFLGLAIYGKRRKNA